MNLNVSPQMRIVALAGLLAALGLVVAVFSLSRHAATKSSEPAPVPGRVVRPQANPKPAPAPTNPARRPVVPQHRVSPVFTAARAAGWPKDVAKSLAANPVVLVELYSSEAPLDVSALAEANAGANQAGVAVVALDVSRKADNATRAVLKKVGTLSSPVLLVLRRPGTVFVHLEGFQDQASVAQAASNAVFPAP